ncbi:ComEC/Rec2 family competence protein [Erysipelotrichaceae bacterium OttesenSCG-928-M19]|nr:ComEC/Rec2 family competence protein [Erysipelotrichaceae bacterium OttesenSCG-928-M19]
MSNHFLHLLIITICLCLGLLYKIISLIVVAIYFLYLLSRYSKKYCLIALVFASCFTFYFNQQLVAVPINNKVFTIVKVNKYNYYAQNNEGKILLKTESKLTKGDQVRITKPLQEITSLENFNLFSYTNYLKSEKIFYETFEKSIKVLNDVKEYTKEKNKVNYYFDYLFFMKKDNIDDEIKTSLVELAIVHLVVVSGFHFNYFFSIFNFIFTFIKQPWLKNLIIFSILGYYLFLLAFSYPALRAFMALIFRQSKLCKKISIINSTALIALVIMLIKPLCLFSTSFLLTFFITFIINLIPSIVKESTILFNSAIFFCNVPFLCSFNFQISPLAILYQIIFSPLIIIFYLLVFLGNYLNPLSNIALLAIKYFEQLIIFINKYNPRLLMGSLPIAFSIIYLIIVFLILFKVKNKVLKVVLPFLIIFGYSFLPSINGFVTFLNVGQGDCIIIKPPLSREAMMIDVAKPYRQETVKNIIVPYLKSQKITKIKQLVITHNDIDHSGGKDDLVKLFTVENIITNKQKYIKFKDYLFVDFLYNTTFKDKNTNSITLYTRINGLNYFFAGDLTKEGEYELTRYVKKIPVDVLKVAHHGSKTSTSNEFLNLTKPKIAIIQAKKNNHYQHPHQEVITRLDNYGASIYNNANNGTITIYYNSFFNYFKKYQ